MAAFRCGREVLPALGSGAGGLRFPGRIRLPGHPHTGISDRMVTVLTIAYIGFYPLDYQFLSCDFLSLRNRAES